MTIPYLYHEIWLAHAVMGDEWYRVFDGVTDPSERARRLGASIETHGLQDKPLGKRGDTVGAAYSRLYGDAVQEEAS